MARRPDLEIAVLVVREAVLRLHWGVSEKRVGVGGFDSFVRRVECGIGVAVCTQRKCRRLFGKFIGLSRKILAALLRSGTIAPIDAKFLARVLRLPPTIRDDGDAAMETEQILRAFNDEAVADAGQGADFVDVGGSDFAGKDGALLEDSIEHAGNFEIDAIWEFAGDDGGIVHAARRSADDFVVFRILWFDGLQIGRSERGDFGGEFAVAKRAIRGGVNYATRGSGALRFGDVPSLRCGGDEHLADCSADAAERVPIDRSGGTATGALRAELCFIEVGLFDADVFPVHVEFIGKNHGQMRFDALTDFRILGEDGDNAIGSDADESEDSEVRLWPGARALRQRRGNGAAIIGDENAAPRDGSDFEKVSTSENSG